ncbi:universal stress protein [Halosimplex pelagicum]|uniref:Universal stress protein n=1 Tax=Halosimplex pelagicum TaxID=869886 RepID=A0A7D5TXA9_9EURY|nr:universal stress protein [Halosimplex pelagicum]QLH84594.1 universal stress protein [Halosimplex pelagicum]
MTRYLLATASVHTTAAAADYLTDRLGADDEVVALTVDEPDLDTRDAGDAANVARSRLLPATVEVVEREGERAAAAPPGNDEGGSADRVAEEIRAVLAEREIDALLLGPRRGDPGASGEGGDSTTGVAPGSTVRALLGRVDVPVVVVPVPELSDSA